MTKFAMETADIPTTQGS